MTVKHTCPYTIFGDYNTRFECGKTARYPLGESWFCGTHHPDRIRDRRDQREALRRAKDARAAEWAKANRTVRLATVREIIGAHARDCGCAERILADLDKEFAQ